MNKHRHAPIRLQLPILTGTALIESMYSTSPLSYTAETWALIININVRAANSITTEKLQNSISHVPDPFHFREQSRWIYVWAHHSGPFILSFDLKLHKSRFRFPRYFRKSNMSVGISNGLREPFRNSNMSVVISNGLREPLKYTYSTLETEYITLSVF